MSPAAPVRPHAVRPGLFASLGKGIVRHPWYPIIAWILILVAALPLLPLLNNVTTSSATNLPASAPSSAAQAELNRLFPGQSFPTDSVILLTGNNVTDTTSVKSTLAATSALANDSSLHDVGSISSLYTVYTSYLQGMAFTTQSVIRGLNTGSYSITQVANTTNSLIWGTPAQFLANWDSLVAGHPGTPTSSWNYPAYNVTASALTRSPDALAILSAFYNGAGTSGAGFNGTANCAVQPLPSIPQCVDQVVRANLANILSANPSSILPATDDGWVAIGFLVVENIGVENWTLYPTVVNVLSDFAVPLVGLPASWIRLVWMGLGAGNVGANAIAAFSSGVVSSGTPASYPLPVPPFIRHQFLSADNRLSIIIVAYTRSSGYTDPRGTNPVFADVLEIDRLIPSVLSTNDPGHTLTYAQTGAAALDRTESVDLAATLSIVLPLTLVTLLIITILYFRAPLAPILTFGALGIAIAIGLAGVVILGTLVTHVDTTALTLVNTFILGVGTDYAIFLVARYREELLRGKSPREAVEASVAWAGQSIATSGACAIIATLALAFSGVALLSQWGMTLSFAIAGAVLVSLTLVPALLALLGPRVFWPYTGKRFQNAAARNQDRQGREITYFHRAGRFSQRHPKAVVGTVVAISIPLLAVALFVVPLSFDFYQQLPGGQPSTNGLSTLATHFGPGFAFPTTVLVTFSRPILSSPLNPSNVDRAELGELGQLTTLAEQTPGIATVGSPVGADGAPLAAWLNFSTSPPAARAQLLGLISGYVGTDGTTVALTIFYSTNGLSSASVQTLQRLESRLNGYAAGQPDVTGVGYGGGAPLTRDIQQQTALATERMVLAVSVGLVIVLLVVLRSALIPILAVATIGLSIGWAWSITYFVFGGLFGLPLFFYVPTVLFILILGLGIDYNIFVLTRVREERLKHDSSGEAVVRSVAATGGIITAAAVILASAFAILVTGNFVLLKAIGFSVAVAVVLDAMVVRTYLVPAALHLLGERVWVLRPRRRGPRTGSKAERVAPEGPGSSG